MVWVGTGGGGRGELLIFVRFTCRWQRSVPVGRGKVRPTSRESHLDSSHTSSAPWERGADLAKYDLLFFQSLVSMTVFFLSSHCILPISLFIDIDLLLYFHARDFKDETNVLKIIDIKKFKKRTES